MTKVLAVLADGLGFQFSKQIASTDSNNIFKTIVPLNSTLGYSTALHPTIWSSVTPDVHNYWAYYAYNNKPFSKSLKINNSIWAFETMLNKALSLILRAYGRHLTVPSCVKGFFDEVGPDDTIPLKTERNPTIFDIMSQTSISWNYLFCPRLSDLMSVKITDSQMTAVLLGEIDSIGHSHGPNSNVLDKALKSFYSWLKEERNNFDHILVFGDHGMCRVTNHLDVKKSLENTSLRHGEDYLAFLDATMARFWYNDEKIGEDLANTLENAPGTLIFSEKFRTYNVPSSRKWGDLIFVVNPGFEIYPNYFHPIFKGLFKGLHGYLPEHTSALALLASTVSLRANCGTLLDICPTIAKLLGVKTPRMWQGRSLL